MCVVREMLTRRWLPGATANAIEAKQAEFCAEPEIPIGRLGHRVDVALEGPILDGPRGMRVLTDVQSDGSNAECKRRLPAGWTDRRPPSFAAFPCVEYISLGLARIRCPLSRRETDNRHRSAGARKCLPAEFYRTSQEHHGIIISGVIIYSPSEIDPAVDASPSQLRIPDQYPSREHQRTAQGHLHGGRKRWRVHEAVTYPGDGCQLDQHHPMATVVATLKSWRRNGNVCPMPPRAVIGSAD